MKIAILGSLVVCLWALASCKHRTEGFALKEDSTEPRREYIQFSSDKTFVVIVEEDTFPIELREFTKDDSKVTELGIRPETISGEQHAFKIQSEVVSKNEKSRGMVHEIFKNMQLCFRVSDNEKLKWTLIRDYREKLEQRIQVPESTTFYRSFDDQLYDCVPTNLPNVVAVVDKY